MLLRFSLKILSLKAEEGKFRVSVTVELSVVAIGKRVEGVNFHSQRLRDALLSVTRPYLISPRLCMVCSVAALCLRLSTDGEREQTARNFYEGGKKRAVSKVGRAAPS